MIHIIDLSRIIFRIYEKRPKQPYIFAVDKSSCTSKGSQKNIIEAISKRIGSLNAKHQTSDQLIKNPSYAVLQYNLKVVTSKTILEDEKFEPPEPEEGQEPQIKPFEWHCEKGICENIIKVNEEFNSYNKLKPMRLLISGPPGSGKTHYSKMYYYNVELQNTLMFHILELRIYLNTLLKLKEKPVMKLGHHLRSRSKSTQRNTRHSLIKKKKKGWRQTNLNHA